MTRVLVTGSRLHADRRVVYGTLWAWLKSTDGRPLTVVHGACPSGADQHALAWANGAAALMLPVTGEPHPADWKMGKQAGHWRNQYMVDLGADVVLAFPWEGAGNVGTADCVRRAREAGLRVIEIPEGLL